MGGVQVHNGRSEQPAAKQGCLGKVARPGRWQVGERRRGGGGDKQAGFVELSGHRATQHSTNRHRQHSRSAFFCFLCLCLSSSAKMVGSGRYSVPQPWS